MERLPEYVDAEGFVCHESLDDVWNEMFVRFDAALGGERAGKLAQVIVDWLRQNARE